MITAALQEMELQVSANVLNQLRIISIIKDNLQKTFFCCIFFCPSSFIPNLCFSLMHSFIFHSLSHSVAGEHKRHNKVFFLGVMILPTGLRGYSDPALPLQTTALRAKEP